MPQGEERKHLLAKFTEFMCPNDRERDDSYV